MTVETGAEQRHSEPHDRDGTWVIPPAPRRKRRVELCQILPDRTRIPRSGLHALDDGTRVTRLEYAWDPPLALWCGSDAMTGTRHGR